MEDKSTFIEEKTRPNKDILDRYSDKITNSLFVGKVYFGINKTIDLCLEGKFKSEEEFTKYFLNEIRTPFGANRSITRFNGGAG